MSSDSSSSGIVGVLTVVPEWPECSPDVMITLLKKLDPKSEPDCLGTNTKTSFYSTYDNYASLNGDQKNKTLAFFAKLPDKKKTELISLCKAESAKVTLSEKTRRDTITKDDLCRVLELRKDPQSQKHWSRTDCTLNRRQLDARKSASPDASGRGTLADDSDPFGALAVRFNDYECFKPQNRVIQYEDHDGVSVPIVPFRPDSEEVTALAAHCHDLQPCNPQRSTIYRDGAWLKEQWTMLKTMMTLVLGDFNRSGQQADRSTADSAWLSAGECSRWVYHAHNMNRRYPSVVSYAYAVLDKEDFDCLGKQMAVGTGRDCSVDGHNMGDSAAANAKRKVRIEKTAAKRKKARTSAVDDDSGGESLPSVISTISSREQIIDILKFKILHGATIKEKQDASSALDSLLESIAKSVKVRHSQHSDGNKRRSAAAAHSSTGESDSDSEEEDEED